MASYLRVKQRTEGGVIHRFSTKSMYQEIPTSSGFEASQGAWGSFSPEFLGIEEYVLSVLLKIACHLHREMNGPRLNPHGNDKHHTKMGIHMGYPLSSFPRLPQDYASRATSGSVTNATSSCSNQIGSLICVPSSTIW